MYWGRDDKTIHVIASRKHYVHDIASEKEDTLEFVSSVGDRVVVSLTDEERTQLEQARLTWQPFCIAFSTSSRARAGIMKPKPFASL